MKFIENIHFTKSVIALKFRLIFIEYILFYLNIVSFSNFTNKYSSFIILLFLAFIILFI